MASDIRRIFELPFGYKATFRFDDLSHWEVSWEPDLPRLRTGRARRKFMAAYQAARRDFLAEVAAVVGGSVLVADADAPDPFEVIRPPARH
jgi:hypothetical protein